MRITNKKLSQIFCLSLAITFTSINIWSAQVLALPPKQKAIMDRGIEYYNEAVCNAVDSDDSSGSLSGSNNPEKVFNFLVSKGLSKEQAAGALGNIMQESGADPQLVQDPPGGRSKTPTSGGWGLIQWTPGTKVIGIAKSQNVDGPIYELSTQLEILWNHMEGTSPTGVQNMLKDFKKITDVKQATDYFEHNVEGAGIPMMAKRYAYAKVALKKYGGGATASATTGPGDSDSSDGTCACADSVATAEEQIKDLAEENGGKTSISVTAIDGTIKSDANGSIQMPTRSSYKLYTAYATLKAMEDGKISWSTKIWGSRSVEATMKEMIVKSNNDAAEALRTNTTIGTPAEVTKLLQDKVGLSSKTIMGSGRASDPAGSNSKSTSNDFAEFLVLLEGRELPGVSKDDSYDKLLGFMKEATTDGGSKRDGIVAGVGKSVTVADKPGWAGGSTDPASNDVGIVYLKANPYVVAILTDKPNKWDGVEKIAKGVHEIMSKTTSKGSGCEGVVADGDLIGTVKKYAWPEYHSAPYLARKPDYATAVSKADRTGIYRGGTVGGVSGIDCGGFVTLAMINSGFEPDYNYKGKTSGGAGYTVIQENWLRKNWQKINPSSTKDMEPGDVAINDTHTYMYVGKVDGFKSVTASASYSTSGNGRAPMAGHEAAADKSFNWYRRK